MLLLYVLSTAGATRISSSTAGKQYEYDKLYLDGQYAYLHIV